VVNIKEDITDIFLTTVYPNTRDHLEDLGMGWTVLKRI
jgi:hypothetical protein